MPRIEPGAAGREARMLPLRNAALLLVDTSLRPLKYFLMAAVDPGPRQRGMTV